ncbi:hypothetical protein M514_06152 [Trichuris suis]|uniref:Uncharacterized protein n=1 Tax=Trichuris suis TaxID=68888 RepID=A0A085NK27_9BILA|nr:hypothetical protein M513_06152 [Trichuris suis]KFD69823.1 hypothetical protein M514_06152 [Trichuris suis]
MEFSVSPEDVTISPSRNPVGQTIGIPQVAVCRALKHLQDDTVRINPKRRFRKRYAGLLRMQDIMATNREKQEEQTPRQEHM